MAFVGDGTVVGCVTEKGAVVLFNVAMDRYEVGYNLFLEIVGNATQRSLIVLPVKPQIKLCLLIVSLSSLR